MVISPSEISSYSSASDMHYPDGTLLKGSDPPVYVLENGQKRWISSPEVFCFLNYDWNNIILVNNTEINYYPLGTSF